MKKELRSEEFLRDTMDGFTKTVYLLALSQVHRSEDAEDICQDVFLRLLQDDTFFSDEEHLKAWLLRVTLNRCRDFFRLAFNRKRDPLEENRTEKEAPPLENDVWESVDSLPPKLRAVVHLHYAEGYSCEEIAGILNCTCTAVNSRLHRARKQLKLELTDSEQTVLKPEGNQHEKSTQCL
ncbi:MAG: RNA polymerase sigma factor [Ruminococcaceae bacterium]|jgi:RNA polymerase sigma-70 factor (ECF subfamily)|nr:RNA polymerase sigma factor [Oscillospiraceae bacterium]